VETKSTSSSTFACTRVTFDLPQTGSGKTFTITGGAMHYADRGIIPRTLSSIFSEVTKRSDHQYQVCK